MKKYEAAVNYIFVKGDKVHVAGRIRGEEPSYG